MHLKSGLRPCSGTLDVCGRADKEGASLSLFTSKLTKGWETPGEGQKPTGLSCFNRLQRGNAEHCGETGFVGTPREGERM